MFKKAVFSTVTAATLLLGAAPAVTQAAPSTPTAPAAAKGCYVGVKYMNINKKGVSYKLTVAANLSLNAKVQSSFVSIIRTSDLKEIYLTRSAPSKVWFESSRPAAVSIYAGSVSKTWFKIPVKKVLTSSRPCY